MADLRFQKMNKKNEKQAGFILLESLISLSLLTFILFFSVPISVKLISYLETQRIQVEIDRTLYDTSKIWSQKEKTPVSIRSYENDFEVKETVNAIAVKENDSEEKRLEIISVMLSE